MQKIFVFSLLPSILYLSVLLKRGQEFEQSSAANDKLTLANLARLAALLSKAISRCQDFLERRVMLSRPSIDRKSESWSVKGINNCRAKQFKAADRGNLPRYSKEVGTLYHLGVLEVAVEAVQFGYLLTRWPFIRFALSPFLFAL
jgi:hypothetical protein